jgi:hypothetical protein
MIRCNFLYGPAVKFLRALKLLSKDWDEMLRAFVRRPRASRELYIVWTIFARDWNDKSLDEITCECAPRSADRAVVETHLRSSFLAHPWSVAHDHHEIAKEDATMTYESNAIALTAISGVNKYFL